MNVKVVSRLVYALYMISLVLVFTTLHSNHVTRSIIFSVFIAMSGIYLTIKLIALRKKAGENPSAQVSETQKAANRIVIVSAFGAMIAVTLIVWHMRQIGLPLLNASLVTTIVGFITLMAAPQKRHPFLSPKQIKAYSRILCLSIICTITGLLIRINHYPGGVQFEYGGVATLLVAVILFIIYVKYKKGKLEQ